MRIPALALLAACIVALPACSDVQTRDPTVADVLPDEDARRLAAAACDGDRERVRSLLAGGTAVDATGRFGVTPLIWALTCRGLEFNDIIANRAVRTGVPIIPNPVDRDHLSAIAELLEAGADPNRMIDGAFGPVYPGATAHWIDRYSPVLIAAEFHEADVLRLLLAHGGDPQAVSGDEDTSTLILAYSRGEWLDLGPQMSPDRARPWANLHLLLQSGAKLHQTVGNRYNVVETASMHRPTLALELLQTYPYEGEYDTIAYHQLNALEMDFPGAAARHALLHFLRDAKGVDLEAVRKRYRMASPDRVGTQE
jgi:ankyrin repeat protein